MWQAVLLCAYLTAVSTLHLDSSPMHDFNMQAYLSAREWTPVGIQVVDFDVDPHTVADQPAEDEMDEQVHGVTTLDKCSVTMDKVAALPTYLREPIVSLAVKSMEDLEVGDEDPTSDDHLFLEEFDLNEGNLEDDGDKEMMLSDEELKKLEDSWTAEDKEKIKRKLYTYLAEDGLTEEEMKKVALESHDLAKSFLAYRFWWKNSGVSRRPRCLEGVNVCASKWRKLLFQGRTYCCQNLKGFPRIFQRGNVRVCNC
ncbi:uncharacterized protein LOC125047648 [Penaeus chinensis]|uniref:uncharacterized protein LOC125047648 n=1 Tax=Penaeus chinensis TaxID=139456 RepID=UPI001FB65255|nr:uncharacterized protein LOC125047648 [Penaeus chinensis]